MGNKEETVINGIDVSNYQGPAFDWESYRGRIQFAGIKVSEGTGYADPDAARNIAGARSIGAAVMGYHFLHANSDGAMQADAFMSHCKAAGLERGDLMAVDVEQGGLDGLPWVNIWAVAVRFATVIHDHFGAWPVLYTDISMAGGAPGFEPLGNCPLWLANPSGTPVSHIGPWQVVSFEQLGVVGVDADVFYGTAEQLAKLAIPVAPAAPPAPAKPTQAEAMAALDVLTRYVGLCSPGGPTRQVAACCSGTSTGTSSNGACAGCCAWWPGLTVSCGGTSCTCAPRASCGRGG